MTLPGGVVRERLERMTQWAGCRSEPHCCMARWSGLALLQPDQQLPTMKTSFSPLSLGPFSHFPSFLPASFRKGPSVLEDTEVKKNTPVL